MTRVLDVGPEMMIIFAPSVTLAIKLSLAIFTPRSRAMLIGKARGIPILGLLLQGALFRQQNSLAFELEIFSHPAIRGSGKLLP